MFDIGFWELILIAVMGLVILGPQRLPGAIRSVSQTIAKVRAIATSAQEELNRELKIQELHENLRKAEEMDMNKLSPELRESVEELKKAAQEVTRPYADSAESLKQSKEQLTQSVESLKAEVEQPAKPASDQAEPTEQQDKKI